MTGERKVDDWDIKSDDYKEITVYDQEMKSVHLTNMRLKLLEKCQFNIPETQTAGLHPALLR